MADWEDVSGQWEDVSPKLTRAQIRTQIQNDPITQGAIHHADDMGTLDRTRAGAGKFFSDIGKGVAQWTPFGPSRKEIDESNERDTPLMATPAGFLGNLGGGAAATVPLAMIPGANTLAGTAVGGGILGAAQPVGQDESRTMNTALGGVVGPLAKIGLDKLGGFLQQRASNKAAELAAEQSRNSVRDTTLMEARQAGYVVPPSATGDAGFVTKRVEGVGGKAAIGQEAAGRNQEVTNNLARKALGLGENEPITPTVLENLRENAAAPYREIAKIDPAVAADLEALKVARNEAKVYFTHYDRSADPKSLAEARKQDALAKRLEGYIEDAANNAGIPGLVQKLRDARQMIAKTYDVERALNVATGDVSAPIIGRMVDKGKPLTGELATIGKFAEAFPSYAREGAKIPTPGVSKSEALAASMLSLGGMGVAGPWGAAAGLMPLASGPARSMALSGFGQRTMGTPNYNVPMTTRLMSEAANNPMLKRTLPLAAVPSVIGVAE
jgi:hypothetical protein